jgi:hypothetical protein
MKNRIVKVLLVVLILTEAKLLFFPTMSTKASHRRSLALVWLVYRRNGENLSEVQSNRESLFGIDKEPFGSLPLFPATEQSHR